MTNIRIYVISRVRQAGLPPWVVKSLDILICVKYYMLPQPVGLLKLTLNLLLNLIIQER